MLIQKLHLQEQDLLKRAAVLLFHPDPETYFTGAYVKIGYFRTETDLLFQNEIHGHLFEQVEQTMDLLLSKYLKAAIRYEGISRIEEYPYPEAALREALINAIAHKDYGSGNPIQIKVYDNRITFWNAGQLPETWTVAHLMQEHPSIPYNPDIATAFFRAGLIEAWGQGTLKIIAQCKESGLLDPVFSYDFGGFHIEFKAKKSSEKSSEKGSEKSSEKIIKLIRRNKSVTTAELAESIGISTRAVEKQLSKLKKQGRIKRIGADRGGYWKVI